jgi:uncharacterized membrane protein
VHWAAAALRGNLATRAVFGGMDHATPTSSLRWTIVLGFGLGGFFDGIILHQVLQWHHLLSLWNETGDLAGMCCGTGSFTC